MDLRSSNYLEFLSDCMDVWQAGSLTVYVRRKEKSAVSELSLKNHLNAVSGWKLLSEAVHLLCTVRNEDAIMERKY